MTTAIKLSKPMQEIMSKQLKIALAFVNDQDEGRELDLAALHEHFTECERLMVKARGRAGFLTNPHDCEAARIYAGRCITLYPYYHEWKKSQKPRKATG